MSIQVTTCSMQLLFNRGCKCLHNPNLCNMNRKHSVMPTALPQPWCYIESTIDHDRGKQYDERIPCLKFRLNTCIMFITWLKWTYASYRLLCSTCACLVFNLPKCIKAIFIAWSAIFISSSAFTTVDHFGTSRFIHSISISCLHLVVVSRSRCMVLRTDSGTLRDKPSWNQSVTSCSSLTSSFKFASPVKGQVTKLTKTAC